MGRRRAPAWPPELAPDETVLLEGEGAALQCQNASVALVARTAAGVLFILVAINWTASGTDAQGPLGDAMRLIFQAAVAFAVFVTLSNREALRHSQWMLTSRRFVLRSAGSIPRDEIGKVARRGTSVIVHRRGPDEFLNGPKFVLPFLRDPEGVRDALERLK